jgi:putative hydrolase of the HAD superfamily
MIKPYRCIFEYFLKKYSLRPEECLLIDDQQENIKAARALGMHAVRIKNGNYRALLRKLKKRDILL